MQPTTAIDQGESELFGASTGTNGVFACNTPSTLTVAAGQHTINVKKKNYPDWTRTMNVSGSIVHFNADLSSAK